MLVGMLVGSGIGTGNSVGTGSSVGIGHGRGCRVGVGVGRGCGFGSDDRSGVGVRRGRGGGSAEGSRRGSGELERSGAIPSVRETPADDDGETAGTGAGGVEGGPGRIPFAANATPPTLSPASTNPATLTSRSRDDPGTPAAGVGDSRSRWNAATAASSPAYSCERGGPPAADSTFRSGSGVAEPRPDSNSADRARSIRRRRKPLISSR
jgi:hypothetical protein